MNAKIDRSAVIFGHRSLSEPVEVWERWLVFSWKGWSDMINWKRVAELQDEIGPDDFLEVAGMFLEEADQTIAQLAGVLSAPAIEAKLHFLKGSALNLGLSDLASICQEGERLAASGGCATVELQRIIAVYLSSRAAFLGGIPTVSTA